MTNATEVSDRDLLARARAGDQLAYRALVERYEPQVAATVIGMLGRGPEAEDVGQTTFIRFYRALDSFRGDSTIGTYITRIAINLSLNALKRRKRDRRRFVSRDDAEAEAEWADEQAGSGSENADQVQIVRRAVDSLPPKYRTVVVLRMIQGFSTKETAALLGIPVGTVLSRLARAQIRLRKLLEPVIDVDAR